jgi:catechol 2,3-dioxygenase-like lactoylglutathione lyase family enzyme
MSQILQHHYVLAVHDVRRSADFYVKMLGFRIVDEPEGWVFQDQPWNMREFALRTVDGHRITIGHSLRDRSQSKPGLSNPGEPRD